MIIPAATASGVVVIDAFEVDTVKLEIQAVRVARRSHGSATARVLLLPAGEGANPRLGDGFALAANWLRGSSVNVEIVYPDFKVPPGWFADRADVPRLPETAILELARHWREARPLPLYIMGFQQIRIRSHVTAGQALRSKIVLGCGCLGCTADAAEYCQQQHAGKLWGHG